MTNGSRRENYDAYLLSEHWSVLRKAVFLKSDHRCEACNSKPPCLHGHHLTYRDPLESCTTADVMALCEPCHMIWHDFLRSIGEREKDYSRYQTAKACLFLRMVKKEKPPVYATPAPSMPSSWTPVTHVKISKAQRKLMISQRRNETWQRVRHTIEAAHWRIPDRRKFKQWVKREFKNERELKSIVCRAMMFRSQLAKQRQPF